jgi:inhibitor of growth protein 3
MQRTDREGSSAATRDDGEHHAVREKGTAPRRTAPAGEDDDDAMDVDDDDGGDDKKYCLCQNVSFGDMVACDNDDCPYEWFHWSCVNLKSEPNGTWYCPVCTENMKKKGK